MFTQGQLLGMQTSLLERLKTEIKAWDNVAERHPYSGYRKKEMPAFSKSRSKDPFTTAFGEGLPLRVYDRNRQQRALEHNERSMQKPFPAGYTGHVRDVRFVDGQTYGRQVREQLNGVAPVSGDRPASGSSHRDQFRHPQEVVCEGYERATRARAQSASVRRPDQQSMYVSSSHLAHRAPGPECYFTPAWSERSTSNIGQPDVYGHAMEKPTHTRQPARRAQSSAARESLRSMPAAGAKSGQRPDSVQPPQRIAAAAGMASRKDAWVYQASK
mmetsp:Transcript_51679/g.143101  ORF Transcript_51679/g.143101 Transcript_51679/m.143101 type:complete len:272 (-) Transcript_51679:405-1220(-)